MTIIEHQKNEADEAKWKRNAEAIIACARGTVATLRDAQREHAATELERLLFIHDAEDSERRQWLAHHAEEILDAMTAAFNRRPL